MRRWLISGMTLSLVVLVLTQAGAQAPVPFNPKTVETVEGIVVEAPEFKHVDIPEMEHLTLKTKQEKLIVLLAPNWFLAKQDWKITPLDRLEITGSRLTLEGKPAMIAQEVEKDGKIMKLRDESGRPRWAPPYGKEQ
jgi:hypothetical protein